MLKLVLSVVFLFHLSYGAAIKRGPQCGYQTCPQLKEKLINVHLIPHTHDDVGWLKTVDQYYYGANNTIQNAGVQYILDSVIDELKKDASRRFIYVETAYFWKWWIHQHDIVKTQVRKLVNSGQLEFIGGAWTMNDEATTHYQSIIDQFTWGLRKLNDSFGDCGKPKIGWQIDPFGHSREMASIFAQLGFDGLLLGRIDYQDKKHRFSTQTPEVIWQGSENLENANIFTGVMYNTYAPPAGFCFDILCEDEPLIDDKRSPLYNIDRKVDDFFAYLNNVSKAYTTNNVIITMGEDFNYQNAHTWFKNMDKLIYYANQRQENGSMYNLFYSTPSCYIKAVHDANKNFQVKTDDFFPYSSDPNSFWTGYFTSRPTLKRFERQANNFLQVCKQLYALADLGPEDWVDLIALREAMGVMQHHDAITGTEKQHVAEDYARILQRGIDECEFIVNSALSKIITGENRTDSDPVPKIPMNSCWLTNVSSCPFTEANDEFMVTVYNPLSRPVIKYVRLPVSGTAYDVKDPDGNSVVTQLIPTSPAILNIPGRQSRAKVELVFIADVPPLGFKSYLVTLKNGNEITKAEDITEINDGEVGFGLDPNTGLLKNVIMNGKTITIGQEFLYYEGFVGNNKVAENRSSGAYIFRPLPSKEPIEIADKVQFKVYRGELISEVQQVFNEWVSQIIRIYSKENYIEFDWLVGPIPNNTINGKEIITRFTTDLNTQATFYTDSNGREILKRIRGARPSWKLNLKEPVSGNYYPITSKIILMDEKQDVELAILTDRAQGGSSLRDGEVELMVHRRCHHDDAFGVGEALNETAFGKPLVARGSHYLILGPRTSKSGEVSTAAQEREVAQRKILDAWILISPPYNVSENYLTQYSGLKNVLPNNVQILTLEPWKGFDFLLRLEHILEKSEDPILSKPAVVDLAELFLAFEILNVKETNLGANQWAEDVDRLQFQSTNSSYHRNNRAAVVQTSENYQITLNPMQIRTFVIEVKNKGRKHFRADKH